MFNSGCQAHTSSVFPTEVSPQYLLSFSNPLLVQRILIHTEQFIDVSGTCPWAHDPSCSNQITGGIHVRMPRVPNAPRHHPTIIWEAKLNGQALVRLTHTEAKDAGNLQTSPASLCLVAPLIQTPSHGWIRLIKV